MDFFLPPNILVLYYQNVALRVESHVQALPVPQDEIDWGPSHREVKRPRAGKQGVIQNS